jgi:PEP-CTERM motif
MNTYSRTYVHWIFTGLLILFCQSAYADSYVVNNLSFSTTAQSMWGSGNAPGFDFNYFLGSTWNTPTTEVGGITGSKNAVIISGQSWTISYYEPKIWIPTPSFSHPFAGHYSGCGCWKDKTVTTPPVTGDTRTGVVLDAQTSGKAGFDLSTSADSGSVNADVLYNAALNVPAANSITPGQVFNLNPSSTLSASSTFSTQSPTVSASVDAVLGTKATFGAQACVAALGCTPDNNVADTTVGFDPQTLPLLSFNTPDSPGQIKVLGSLDPSAFQFGSPIKIPPGDPALNFGDVTAYVPDVATTGTTNGDLLKGSGTGNLLDINANLTGLILNAFGLPAVLGTSVDFAGGTFSVGYDLIKVEYGPSLKLLQDFQLDPTLMVDLSFDHPVNVDGLGIVTSLSSPWDSLPSFSLLDDTPVTVTPTFWLDAMFTNDTTLGIFGNFTLDALDASLSVNALGLSGNLLSLGPLYSLNKSNDFYNLPALFDNTFTLDGFNRITEDPFTLSALTTPNSQSVPEPSTLALFAFGLGLGAITFRNQKNG